MIDLQQVLGDRPAWIVGGTVRDELLGRPLRDIDLAVVGDPEPPAREIAAAVRGPVFRLSEAFGAWRVIDRGTIYDVSPLQGETVEEDLGRRDFTVNAMARSLAGGELIDPHGGRGDLEERVLRVLGAGAYRDDPLRPLRLARLAAELDFAPDSETERLTREAAPRVADASPERQFAELRRLMLAPRILDGLGLADRLGVLEAVLPEVTALHGLEQSHFHHLDVYDHTLEVVGHQVELEGRLEEFEPRLRAALDEPLGEELSRLEAIRFGALLHDIGKPATRGTRPDGRVTFIGHDTVGEEMVHVLCRRLRTSERFARFVGGLTKHHLVLGFLVHQRPLSRETVFAYLDLTEPVEVEVTLLSCADRLATRGKNAEQAIERHLDLAKELMTEALDWRSSGGPKAPIRGDELADALGVERGPELGGLLEQLRRAAFTGEAQTPDQAVELARKLRHNP